VEVSAHKVRLGSDIELRIAGSLNERGVPSGGDRSDRVAGVTGNQADVARVGAKLADD
jgi:hypothetical protein